MWRLLTLKDEQSAGVCKTLGIEGNASVEHWMNARKRQIVVRAGAERFIIERKRNAANPREDSYSFRKYYDDGEQHYARVINNHIIIRGNPLAATAPVSRAAQFFGIKKEKAAVEFIDSGSDPDRAKKLYGRFVEAGEEIFRETDARAKGICLPETNMFERANGRKRGPEKLPGRAIEYMPCTFYAPQIDGIFHILGFATPAFGDDGGYVTYTPQRDSCIISVNGRLTDSKRARERAYITQHFGGKTHVIISRPGARRNEDHTLYPLPRITDDEKTYAELQVLGGPIRPGTNAFEIRRAMGVVLTEMRWLLTPQPAA